MNVWSFVTMLEGQTLRTLDRGNQFDIVSVEFDKIKVGSPALLVERSKIGGNEQNRM